MTEKKIATFQTQNSSLVIVKHIEAVIPFVGTGPTHNDCKFAILLSSGKEIPITANEKSALVLLLNKEVN